MNVFNYRSAVDSMMHAHAAGRISNQNLLEGGRILKDLYDAQPHAAKIANPLSNGGSQPRIVAAEDDGMHATRIPGNADAEQTFAIPAKQSTITMEIKIDFASPEMQAILRKNADHVACMVDSVDHGSKVIQALEKARQDCVGPTHALDHMIDAVSRRIGRLEFDVKTAVNALYKWRYNGHRAKYQNHAAFLRGKRGKIMHAHAMHDARDLQRIKSMLAPHIK